MKIMTIGDPHIKTDNLSEFNLFVERLCKLIETKNPDRIIILGDILHTHERLHTIALNEAYLFIKKMIQYTKTFVLVGNHDLCGNQEFLTTNHWMNCMKEWGDNLVIVDKVTMDIYNDIKIVLCPYVPNGRFIEALNTIGNTWENSDIIFAHQEFKGCKMGAIISEDGDSWSETYPQIVSGHIHSRQQHQKNIYYPGAAMQHAFGESEINIIAILDVYNKQYDLEEIDLNLPRKKIIYTDVENFDDYKIPKEQDADKIKLTVSGNYEEFKVIKKTKKYRELSKRGVKIVFKQNKIDINDTYKTFEEFVDFRNILQNMIDIERDSYLVSTYEFIINKKEVDPKDIVFLKNI